ncbi:MAG: cytochrome c biogenesis protein CcdA [Candidatus Omnitrophota bacterium]
MNDASNISYAVAFAAGMMVFLSPCILPLIPTYLSYLTGMSFKELEGEITPEKKRRIRARTVAHSLMFIIGFSVVFILLGTTVSFLGRLLLDYQRILKTVSAVLIIGFGLMITGALNIGFLQKEKQVQYRKKGTSYIGSLLVGAAFAFAWTPCVGPILGSILVYASSTASVARGITLLSVFSAGLAVPFFLTGFLINSFLLHFNKIKKIMRVINVLGGIILIVFGVLILTGGVR